MTRYRACCFVEMLRGDMYRLTNAIRPYSWGSDSHIPKFLGLPLTGEPAAELWLGAHPGDPSLLGDGRSLLEAISTEPENMLGDDVANRFGARLPFLMKVLAAAEPLSLQVHPSSQRARLGFEREDREGIPRDAPERSYTDTSHKPEMIYALTRFEGMAGFRDVEMSAHVLRQLRLPWADEIAVRLLTGPAVQALQSVVGDLLRLPAEEVRDLLQQVLVAAADAELRQHRQSAAVRPRAFQGSPIDREAIRVFAQLPGLVERYPADGSILVTLLLNHVVLAPGEAMYLKAGVLHAYTSGLGVEIMASSDNVLRAGLTAKHCDVEEVLRVTDFTPVPAPRWQATALESCTGLRIAPPVTEFAMHVVEAPAHALPDSGPRMVLVLDGEVEIVTASGRTTATRGSSVFVPHAAGPLEILGVGRVALGLVPA